MSGFELAGIVLGALPIAIAALDGYKEANKRFSFWRGVRRHHITFTNDLEYQHRIFELNLQQLLLPLVVVEDDVIAVLLSQPGGPEWKRPDVEEELKSRLGGSYPLYLSIMKALEEAVKRLNGELGVDSASVQAGLQGQKKSLGFQLYRLKLSIDGGSTAKRLLDELTQRNAQLEKLLNQTDKVTQLSRKRDQSGYGGSSARLDTALLSFWKSATSLYKIIQTAWTGCSCLKEHTANMVLQHPATAKKARFEVLFAASDRTEFWRLDRALVTVGEDETRPANQPSCPQTSATKVEPGAREPAHKTARVPKSAIKGKAVARNRSVQLITAPAVVLSGLPQAGRITNLCTSLYSDASSSCCAGFLQCPNDAEARYFLYPQSKQMTPVLKFVTLEQLIREEELPPLSFQQRLFLSMTLASSFLQLLDSPWIHHQWTKADIVFFPDPACPAVFLLEKPHVMGQAEAADPTTGGAGNPRLRSAVEEERRQAALSRLGVVLEELCFRCSVEKRRAQRGYPAARAGGQRQLVLDTEVGVDWLREIGSEAAGLEYKCAVKWCLLDHRVALQESDSWRGEMLKHVVGPLERSYRQFTSSG
ncbi:hypothetical protein RB597_003269 [Gaeumannomyces tritici]